MSLFVGPMADDNCQQLMKYYDHNREHIFPQLAAVAIPAIL